MSSSQSLNHPPTDSPKKSSISSTKSGESDTDRKVNFQNETCEKKHSFSEGKELTKTPSKKEKKDLSKDKEKTERSPSEGKLTKKGSIKELIHRDSLRDISNKSGDQVPKKFISTWKMACDKTKDRTKELLKKWRTGPEDNLESNPSQEQEANTQQEHHGWSVHVWTTWVKRYPSDEDHLSSDDLRVSNLTLVQTEKLKHFFSHVLDMDKDDMISLQDFESFSERLRHFADWSTNCGEYLILMQVQQGFVENFLIPEKNEEGEVIVCVEKLFLSIEDWLFGWSDLLTNVKAVYEFPIWLQYMAKVLFQAINTSGNGRISKDELSSFYLSVLGYQRNIVDDIIEKAFNVMTSNGEHSLNYRTYELIFANFFLGRYPNGPGQYLFGYEDKSSDTFPIDYSALNTAPEDLEHYSPDTRSNRRSIIV